MGKRVCEYNEVLMLRDGMMGRIGNIFGNQVRVQELYNEWWIRGGG